MRALTLLLFVITPLAAAQPASRLRVAVVQMTLGPSLEANRDRIVNWIPKAAARGARVVVFPEGALSVRSSAPQGDVPGAVRLIRETARGNKVYVLFGGWTWSEPHGRATNWMKVIAPDGRELLHYDKLWDVHDARTPAVFSLDGVPASAMICADRWLRALEDLPVQQGARISFELSNNFASEWVPGLQWYWYVPRALRNNVYVVFANTSNRTPGKPEPGVDQRPRHGHSAVIAPDGALVTAARDDLETLLVADLDIARATRAEALARRSNPVMGKFWQAGVDLLEGKAIAPPPLVQKDSAASGITVSAAQIPMSADAGRNVAAMLESIGAAAKRNVDLIAFPELAVTGGKLSVAGDAVERLCAAARANHMVVVFGMPRRQDGRWYNSAVVAGPDGAVLTRYDQLAAQPPFSPGEHPSRMWFSVKGVPAVVTIGREALWNEIAELAAVAGARLHVSLSREPVRSDSEALRRRQIGAALSSFMTFTVMANAGGYSAIWDDLNAGAETRAEVRDLPRPSPGAVRVFSAFSANLVVEANAEPALISATRRVPGRNSHYPQRTGRYHPAMAPWYVFGSQILTGVPNQ
ncbi:MAG: carbon-nitrogen hydrolase family protein [Acidobacteria bacterium]|nr:carbon-nitrogen hydrolase family protein [Acidobacteriota bacterium]